MRYGLAALLLATATPLPAGAAEPRTVQEAAMFARDHCKQLPPGTAATSRYLWLPRQDGKKRYEWWQVCSGWIHGQNRNPGIYPPPVILDGDKGPVERPAFSLKEEEWAQAVMIRVDLSLYRFSPKVWEKFGFQSPYQYRVQHWTGGYESTIVAAPWMAERPEYYKAVDDHYKMTGYVVNVLRADNWFWQTAIVQDRKVGYHGLLEIKNQDDYERAIGYDPKANIDPSFFDEILSAVAKDSSGVAKRSRRIERQRTMGGAYWITKDNESTDDPRHNPLETYDETLLFDAVEAFGNNACGFWVTGLFNSKRKSQNKAPGFVGGNGQTLNNDYEINNGLDCLVCHSNGGLQDVKCHFRGLMQGEQGLFPQTTSFKRFGSLLKYLPPLEVYLTPDRQRYADALWRATALKPQQYASLIQAKYREYDQGVSLERAAEDLGTTPDAVLQRLNEYMDKTKSINAILAPLTVAKEKRSRISIEDWHRQYNTAALAIRGLTEWPKK